LLHCNAGKGRTGTAISSVLLYAGMIDQYMDALNYYSYMRFAGGLGGVTQPCQVRYANYFEDILKKKLCSSPPKVLKQIIIKNIPNIYKAEKLKIEIYQYHYENLIFSTNLSDYYNSYNLKKLSLETIIPEIKICPNISIVLSDDIYIKVLTEGKIKFCLLCRFSFNTAFVDKNK